MNNRTQRRGDNRRDTSAQDKTLDEVIKANEAAYIIGVGEAKRWLSEARAVIEGLLEIAETAIKGDSRTTRARKFLEDTTQGEAGTSEEQKYQSNREFAEIFFEGKKRAMELLPVQSDEGKEGFFHLLREHYVRGFVEGAKWQQSRPTETK